MSKIKRKLATILATDCVFRGFSDRNSEEIFSEAKENINKALELNENDFECHRMLPAVYLSNHDYILAEDH